MNYEILKKNFESHRFRTFFFSTKEEAAFYLKGRICGEIVGFGGSVTVKEMGLYELLGKQNEVIWHWMSDDPETARKQSMDSTVYILSANGIAETGEIVNIDGCGNRIAASLFGPKRVFYVVGKNKISPDLKSAMERARNIACTQNAVRLNVKTPCAANGINKCYDCSSPARICNAFVVLERPCVGMEVEILFIDEELGF